MTKQWMEQSRLAPPALAHLEAHCDHQLDSGSNEYMNYTSRSVSMSSSSKHWTYHSSHAFGKEQRRLDALGCPDHLTGEKAVMDKADSDRGAHGSFYRTTQTREDEANAHDSMDIEREKNSGGRRKKNYQRYPKPPYSYLAMIAMVIQNSPEKKLTLSEILKEISTLFPFFKGNYKGWRDSVRHNLSSYDCFVKVLKDPGKPQGKGNFWAVELSRVPHDLLKRQNTAVSRQDETIFAQDLAPYILQGQIHQPEDVEPPPGEIAPVPPQPPPHHSPPREDLYRPKLDTSFAIDSLLHSLRPASEVDGPHGDFWGEAKHPRPSPPPPLPRYTSSVRSASASSASPASSLSEEDWRAPIKSGKRVSLLDGETASDEYEDCKPPRHKLARRGGGAAPPWELPTSYAKYTPPNAVAPPSMRFNGGPLIPLHGGLPLYSYGGSPVTPGHFLGHTYWPILPSHRISIQPPPIIMDLGSMMQSVPPNKSVFDVLVPSSQSSHHPSLGQYTLQNGPPLTRYPQY